MKKRIIVTHKASDLDAITSAWIIKRFLPGWEIAQIQTVPAGTKLLGNYTSTGDFVEVVDGAEVIHTDTGMGKLDHHQTSDDNICATSLAFDYVLQHEKENGLSLGKPKREAVKRIVDYVVDDDHFQEVFYQNPSSDIYDLSIVGLIHGIKLLYPKDDVTTINFGMELLDAAVHELESKVHAEKELRENGIKFHTRWGESIAVETGNDAVLKLAQTEGYVLSVRKDPETGSIRIKTRPARRQGREFPQGVFEHIDIDLTPVYEKLKQLDSDATWYLHVSKRMLLNGSSKNPTMQGTKLTLSEVVEVLQNV